MEPIEIKSGPTDVLASGTVISFNNNPIELIFGPEHNYFKVILKFELVNDKTKQKIDGMILDKSTIELTFADLDTISGTWTSEPIAIGGFSNKTLYINVHFYIRKDMQSLVNYTVYLEEPKTPPSSVGGEINK
jgi:hypothetical protein